MSKSRLFAQQAKLRTDQAISRVYRSLNAALTGSPAFGEVLDAVRRRSGFLRFPVIVGQRVLQIEALRNLATFVGGFARPVQTWSGSNESFHCVLASLAQHLFLRYEVPKFLNSVWLGDDRAYERAKRRWYIQHGNGRRFRDLALPMVMTRRMESLFLASPDHLTVEQAMRRAELRALGASSPLIDSVLATRLGRDLSHGSFWRTVVAFFVRVSEDLDLAQVGPIVDFLQAVRHERVEVLTQTGAVFLEPPRPGFSLKGRTLRSILRLVERWHDSLGLTTVGHLRWERSRYRPMVFQDRAPDAETPPIRWELVELTNGNELRREGTVLRHCVASYASWCCRGKSRIWSLRRRNLRGKVRSVLTIEVDLGANTIVQARGFWNRPATGKPLWLLQEWARRERLRMPDGVG
jgi:hypothetical protein